MRIRCFHFTCILLINCKIKFLFLSCILSSIVFLHIPSSALFSILICALLCQLLSCIFNLSGEYLSILKFNNVVPIDKMKEDKSSVRSHVLLSPCIQLMDRQRFEKIVNDCPYGLFTHAVDPTASNLMVFRDLSPRP